MASSWRGGAWTPTRTANVGRDREAETAGNSGMPLISTACGEEIGDGGGAAEVSGRGSSSEK